MFVGHINRPTDLAGPHAVRRPQFAPAPRFQDAHSFVVVCFQFVSFREFIGGSYGDDLSRSKVMLAKEVLAEIPDQVMSYMKKYKVRPNPPRYGNTLRSR